MIHIRIDDEIENSKRKFACDIGPELPEGDMYFFASEFAASRSDCPKCHPSGPQKLGTPISKLSGQPDHDGYEEFKRIARSWGYD